MRGTGRWAALVLVGSSLLVGCARDSLEPLPAKFQAVVAGVLHSCGILEDGAAWCWGNNDYGQLGDGSRRTHTYPRQVIGTVRFSALTLGGGHSCGLATSGAAYCWGFNLNGQLGDRTNSDRATPTAVDGGKSWIWLDAGGAYTCGVATDSLAYCWGWNGNGQLGDGTRLDHPTPQPVAGALKFRMVSAGTFHTCGVTSGGDAYCWGANDYGQLGTGDSASTVPVLVQGGRKFVSLTSGFYHTCGLAVDGTAYCWGRNQFGQLGVPDSIQQTAVPAPVSGSLAWGSVSSGGGYFSCGLQAQTGLAYCWGLNSAGQLGTEVEGRCVSETTVYQCSFVPVRVRGNLVFSSLSAATQHACGLTVGGVAYCWGLGSDGQLGNGQKGSTVLSVDPVRVGGQP